MLKEEQKQPILCNLSSSKSLPLESSSSISEKIMHWHQALTIKTIQDVERITKTENIVTTVVEEKFAFENFKKSFDWKGILYVTLATLWIVQMRQNERKLNKVL